MKKSIQGMSTLGKWFALAGVAIIAIEVGYLAYFMFLDTSGLGEVFDLGQISEDFIASLPVHARLAIYVFAVSELIPAIIGFLSAIALFSSFRKGRVFTPGQAKRVEIIGWAITFIPLVETLLDNCILGILALFKTAGEIRFAIDCDEGDLMSVIFGLLFVVLGRIMHEAAILSEENRQFV